MELPTNRAGINVKVSPVDFEVLKNKYIYSSGKYPSLTVNKKTVSLHRYVCSLMNVVIPDKHVVDHINGDKLDARRENLRIVNISQNNQNKRAGASQSGFRGVVKATRSQKWQVYFGSRFLGFTDTAEEGAELYDKYIIKFVHRDNPTNFVYSEAEKDEIINGDFQPREPRSGEVQGYSLTKNGKFKVTVKGKYIGSFSTTEEALQARQKALDAIEEEWRARPVTTNDAGDAVILLTGKNSSNTFTIVDGDMWHDLTRYSWCLGNDGYPRSSQGELHTVITKYWVRRPGEVVDHIDRNKLNNKLSNLRLVSRSENNRNITDETRAARSKSLTGTIRRPVLTRKYAEDVTLPKYVSRLQGATNGYQVAHHPTLKSRQFTRATLKMEEKLAQALEYLRTAEA